MVEEILGTIRAVWQHPITPVIGVLGLLSFFTSPKGVVDLIYILGVQWPASFVTNIFRYCLPALFTKDVKNNVVVITGGASGIGLLVAQRFAKLGSKVVLLDLNEELLRRAEDGVKKFTDDKTKIHRRKVDVTDRPAVYKTFEDIQHKIGDVDILINNAGIVTGKTLLECPDELMEKTMQVNTLSHFWTVKAVLPNMLNRNSGHVVTVSSLAGLIGSPGLVDYSASKFGAVGFHESLSGEIRKQGKNIKTTCIAPFFIKTGMFAGVESKWPRLVPLLEPEWVADRIVRAIRTDELFLIVPLVANIVFLVRALFSYNLANTLVDWFGGSDNMNNFTGRVTTNHTVTTKSKSSAGTKD